LAAWGLPRIKIGDPAAFSASNIDFRPHQDTPLPWFMLKRKAAGPFTPA
jgi:hypothetical protein